MSKWLIKLKGEKIDLDNLRDSLQSPELNIIVDNSSYYLQCSKFDSFNLAKEVCEEGKRQIQSINGWGEFYLNNFQNIALDCVASIEDNGKILKHYVLPAEKGNYRIKGDSANLILTKPDGTRVRAVEQPNPLECYLQAAQKDKIDLYKVYKVIRDDVGGHHQIINNGWVEKPELGLFTQTAQSRAAIGDQARHASKKYDTSFEPTPFKPTPSQPMPLEGANSLIKKLLTDWMNKKNENLKMEKVDDGSTDTA